MRDTSDRTTTTPLAASDPFATLADTEARSVWRAATVAAMGDAAPVSAVMPSDDVGGEVTRYQIHEVIGSGGMGEVRLCRDETIGRDVALKTLLERRAQNKLAQRQFLREARVQGQLEHPSIVPVYDLSTAPDGGLFFTMRRVRGHTLADVLTALAKRDPAIVASYSRRKLLDAFVRVCLAVDYAHARGVLHRDLKPANIMLGGFGEVYLLDWGVARLVADSATDAPIVVGPGDLVSQGNRVGTPGYMSPEQILGLGDNQDARTDVYSLGAILFEILTLERLHEGDSFETLAKATLERAPVCPSAVADDVPPELEAACATAASGDPAKRYASARELAFAVERYLDGDRDLERRRSLAIEKAKTAADAFARGTAADASEEAASLARADAVREVTASLALDPENVEARRLLVRLFVEAPTRMPREVETEIVVASRRSREQFVRFGSYALGSWLGTIPFVIAMGVRSWPPVLLSAGLCLTAFVYAMWLRRRRDFATGRTFVLVFLVFATIASVACWMGPFVLVPQATAVAALWMALICHTRRERWTAVTIGVFAVLGPFLLEFVGAFPPAYVFANGDILLAARAVRFSPHATLPMLVYASAAFVALPAIFLGGIRDALSAAERQLFLQAWHLRQLLRESPPKG